MQPLQIIFIALGTLHGLVGIVLLIAALNRDFQKYCFYRGKDVFVGDIHKTLALLVSSLLIACGALTHFKPGYAVGAAWEALLIYLLPTFVDLMAGRRIKKFCKECAVAFSVRAFAVIVLTAAMPHGLNG